MKIKYNFHGILAFPQMLLIGTITTGIVINLFIPIKLIPRRVQFYAGTIVISLSVYIAAISFHEFRKNRVSIDPKKVPAALITTGPFRCSRNPLYLALCLMELGVGVLLDNIWIIGLLIVVIIVLTHTAISSEERTLTEHFGKEYLKYVSKVRRWI